MIFSLHTQLYHGALIQASLDTSTGVCRAHEWPLLHPTILPALHPGVGGTQETWPQVPALPWVVLGRCWVLGGTGPILGPYWVVLGPYWAGTGYWVVLGPYHGMQPYMGQAAGCPAEPLAPKGALLST